MVELQALLLGGISVGRRAAGNDPQADNAPERSGTLNFTELHHLNVSVQNGHDGLEVFDHWLESFVIRLLS